MSHPVESITAPAPRALVIAPHGSYRTYPYILAAQRLGVSVLIASEGKHSVVSSYANGLHINLNDQDSALRDILEEADRLPFAAVIGTDDATTELAATVARRLGLPHNNPEGVRLARRKDLARQRLAQHGVCIPRFQRIDLRTELLPQLDHVTFPVVVKPIALSASRGVIRANTQEELSHAMARARAIVQQEHATDDEAGHYLLVEEFIPGVEVAVEAMLDNGELSLLAVFDKPDPLDGPFFEETYYITPTRLPMEVVHELRNTVAAACHAYGLTQGPVHAECRINAQGVYLIEMAARTIGGLCSRLLTVGTGQTLEELVLAQAMGKALPQPELQAAAGVLMIPIPKAGVYKRVEGLLAAQGVPGIEEINIQISEGHQLVPLPEGNSYLGFIFARAATPAGVEQALRKAHASLRFVIDPLWTIAAA